MLLLLEDDRRRIHRFKEIMRTLRPSFRVIAWNNAHTMMRECPALLTAAALISLDHDLETSSAQEDPGDGLIITEFLCSQPIIRPVIVHSSNADRSARMMGTLELAHWPFWRVPAIGDDWIETDWKHVAHQILTGRRSPGTGDTRHM